MFSVVDYTALATGGMTAVGSVVIPLWLQRRRKRVNAEADNLASWTGITSLLKAERDRLQTRLDESDDRASTKAARVEKDWAVHMDIAQQRITYLEQEVERYKRIADPPND